MTDYHMKSIPHNLLSTYGHSNKAYRVREEIMVPIHRDLSLVRTEPCHTKYRENRVNMIIN